LEVEMKTLLILRHCKSSWKHADLADHDRPLKPRGVRDAAVIGEYLLARAVVPDLIITSTAKRARMTADLVAQAGGYAGEILPTSKLYLAVPSGMLQVLQNVDARYQRVMVVGHNPGLEELLEVLTGEAPALATGGLACVALPVGGWDEIRMGIEGELLWLV
jgi:phosphohistidine phosphatase